MERLLAALASSVGVALSNARLFDETKRLLADTNERAAELAVINEIGEALAEQLDFDAIIRARRTAGPRAVRRREHVHRPAQPGDEHDRVSLRHRGRAAGRTPGAAHGHGPDLSRDRNAPGPCGWAAAKRSDAAGAIQAGTVDYMESWIGVPIAGQNRVIGVLAMEAAARDAYSESDERVLATLASGMGVALENARLFDETKRLLADDGPACRRACRDQRDRRSARRNSSTSRRSSSWSATASARCSRANSMAIALHDPATNLLSWPYDLDEGEIFHRDPRPLGPGMTSQVIASGDRCASGRWPSRWRRARSRSAARRPCRGSASPSPERTGSSASSRSSHPSRMSTRKPTSASSRRWPRAWAWRSRTPACSTRRSACSRRPTSAPPSSRSSTRSSRRSPRRSTCRRCTTWSASGCARSSTLRSSTSGSWTATTACSTSRTRSSAASGSPTSRSSCSGSGAT